VGHLLSDPAAYAAMASAVNPYGDGRAADRAVAALAHHFGLGPPPAEFDGQPGRMHPESAMACAHCGLIHARSPVNNQE
jgi:hypothetical protein